MSWRIFEPAAAHYESWYTSARGRRADTAERRLLLHLIARFRAARSAIEIGCGTGHFTAILTQHGFAATGLDRSPSMLAQARGLFPSLPVILGDARQLPFGDRCVDLAVFVTTLEFLADPPSALAEAVRVARRGVVAVTLNRHSLGGLSRRWGRQSHGSLLSEASDFSMATLLGELGRAAGARLDDAWSASTLFPDGFYRSISRLPLGDVIGVAISLKPDAPRG